MTTLASELLRLQVAVALAKVVSPRELCGLVTLSFVTNA